MTKRFVLFISTLCLLQGCQAKIPDHTDHFTGQEQQYIDARHGFTLNHPQAWERVTIPVSSPDFREDTVVWKFAVAKKPPALVKVLSAPRSQFSDLPQFSQYSYTSMHHKRGFPDQHKNQDMVSGHFSHAKEEVIYTNLVGNYHYFHLALISPEGMTSEMEKAFNAIVESLQEIKP